MLRIRVIPCLLWQNVGLVKTVNFKNPTYIGDATNAIRIFNDKEVDELMILDINASAKKQGPNFELIEKVASECFMPLSYGGGVRTIGDIKTILSMGVEKVCVNTKAVEDPAFIKEAAQIYGSSTIVVSVDYKKNLFGKNIVCGLNGTNKTKTDPLSFARQMQDAGAGEIVLNSIDRDGTMQGYDIELIKKITESLEIPVTALGGAGSIADLFEVTDKTNVSAVSAGSLFVFKGKHRAVLINYPDQSVFQR